MTGWQKPSPRVLWKAIHAYLGLAYDGSPTEPGALPEQTPSAVRARLETLRSTPDDAFYDSPVFEHPVQDARNPAAPPTKYALRLGNRSYPHMKLLIERGPDQVSYLLRADAHDAHIHARPGSRDAAAFAELVRVNHEMADKIETAWDALGLPTFKKLLREDLLRRKALAETPPST